MTVNRRSFLSLTGTLSAGAALGVPMPSVLRAVSLTPVKMTLPWLPLGTFSHAFVARKMGF